MFWRQHQHIVRADKNICCSSDHESRECARYQPTWLSAPWLTAFRLVQRSEKLARSGFSRIFAVALCQMRGFWNLFWLEVVWKKLFCIQNIFFCAQNIFFCSQRFLLTRSALKIFRVQKNISRQKTWRGWEAFKWPTLVECQIEPEDSKNIFFYNRKAIKRVRHTWSVKCLSAVQIVGQKFWKTMTNSETLWENEEKSRN